MLSVKHILPNGSELVYLAHSAEYVPASVQQYGASPFVSVDDGSQERTLESGTVYVMNENGKTVATYKLGDGKAKIAPDRPYVKASPEEVDAFRQTLAEWHHQPLEAINLEDASGRPDTLYRTVAGHRVPFGWDKGSGEATQESGCISAPANTAGIR